MKLQYRRGFVGLLALILSLALIGLFAWRSDLFTPKIVAPALIDTLVAPTSIPGQLEAIDSARGAKQQLENRYNQKIEGL